MLGRLEASASPQDLRGDLKGWQRRFFARMKNLLIAKKVVWLALIALPVGLELSNSNPRAIERLRKRAGMRRAKPALEALCHLEA